MAKIRSGVLGNTRGKVSGVVGGQWKDVNYIREYVKPANPNTAAQQTIREKMQRVVAFCKPLVGPIFNTYTDRFEKSMSGFNRFVKDNLVLFAASPVYASVKVSVGKLWFGGLLTAPYNDGTGAIVMTFDTSLGNNGAASDVVYAIVYNKDTGFWYMATGTVLRSTGTITVTAPAGLTYTDLLCWALAAKYSQSIVTMISNSSYKVAEVT